MMSMSANAVSREGSSGILTSQRFTFLPLVNVTGRGFKFGVPALVGPARIPPEGGTPNASGTRVSKVSAYPAPSR